jgi:SAM-dependent methyltransferase
MDEPLTEEAVRLAYLLILGRPVESEAMLRFALGYRTLGKLRDAFLNSREFEYILNLRPRLVQPGAPPLSVEWHADDAVLLAMLADVRATWDKVPPPAADGARDAENLAACLRRNGLPPPDSAHAFEFGCGAGRVSRHLAPLVRTLTAADASPAQLAAAQRVAAGAGLRNLTLRPADDLRFGMTEAFDLLYSFHALHHSPPPLAARALARAFALLRPGGVAVFQLISYGAGYGFSAAGPPPTQPGDPCDHKHVLPQPAVFAIAAGEGCEPVEVFEDLSVAPSALWRSTMFVLRKRAG